MTPHPDDSNPDPDEPALSWGQESDPTYLDSTPAPTSTPASAADPVAGPDSAADTDEAPATAATDGVATDGATTATDERPGMSSAMLVTLGILAGVYLLYTAGWFTSAVRTIAVPVDALDVVMVKLRQYLSIAAPVLWFGATLLLTRARRPVLRLLWLVLGALVLLPLPFVLGE